MTAAHEGERLARLERELETLRLREREVNDLRRAMLNLLEDLDEDREHLTRAEREWRAAFNGIRDAMFMHDADLRITRANTAYLSLAGVTDEPVEGRLYWEVFPKGNGPIPGCREYAVKDMDLPVGNQVYRSRAYAVYGAEGDYAFSVHFFEDITERRRAEEQIRQHAEQLSRSNIALRHAMTELQNAEHVLVQTEKLAAIGTLASSVAHELNNPLMGVKNYVSYARAKLNDEKGAEALDKASRELQRMEGVVRNLLLLGRPAGEFIEPIDARIAVDLALDLLAGDLRSRGIDVIIDWPQLPRVWGSMAPMQQVFINLLLNAVTAMEQSAKKEVRFEASDIDGRVRIVIADTGHGIPEQVRPHLFEPFFSTRPEGRGTGLGLPISRRIMESFGGTLDFDPGRAPGAAFVLTLRIANL